MQMARQVLRGSSGNNAVLVLEGKAKSMVSEHTAKKALD